MDNRFELEGGGLLEIREDHGRVCCSVRRLTDGAGIYKVWLLGGQGQFLLGTLIPEGKFLRLERSVSLGELQRSGCWPVVGGKCALTFSFSQSEPKKELPSWRWEHRPAALIRDPVLAESASAWGSMLLRQDEEGFALAAPLDHHRPFPLTALFCLAQLVRIDGQNHVQFSFDNEGCPRTEKDA